LKNLEGKVTYKQEDNFSPAKRILWVLKV
jgi:hypothetical protein